MNAEPVAAVGAQIVGRVDERTAVDRALAAIRGGHSAALVLRGEAGIGKSRLLQYAAESVSGAHVLRTSGVEGESQMAFAGLHHVMLPLLPRAAQLPEPQDAALRAVFGRSAGTAPDRFLVGLAVLTLLTDAALDTPVVVIVDDAQWLDPESLAVLAFVARRLAADPVAVLVATRDDDPTGALAGLPSMALTGLSEAEAAAMLGSRPGAAPDAPTVRRVVQETGGNPLAITELVDELGGRPWPTGMPLPDPRPVATRLETHFLRQVRDLPADTRTVLLLAAADPTRDADLLHRASRLFGLTLAAADPAVSARVLTLHPTPTFRHPLIRSAVYRGAAPAERRRAHHALAAATDIATDPDRRAWHQAAASLGPDAQVAERLELSARRAGARGGYSMQAAFLDRAAELSPDRVERSRLMLAAAQAHLVADEVPAAERHLRDALVELRDPLLRIRARRLHAAIEIVSVRPSGAPAVLLEAIAAARETDPDLAWDMAFEALGAALLAGEYTAGTTLPAVAAAALDLPPRKFETRTSDLVLHALSTRLVHGQPAAVGLLRGAVGAVVDDPDPSEVSVPLAVLGATAAAELWDDVGRRALLDRLIAVDRRRGAANALRVSLEISAAGHIWAGDFQGATTLYSESESLYRARGSTHHVAHHTELLAWQGETGAVDDATRLMIEQWGPLARIGAMEQLGHLTRSLAANSVGRYDDGVPSLRRLLDVDPLGLGAQALPEVVEAATRTGHHDLAATALARLDERARASGTPWGLGVLARSRALTAVGAEAEDLYREAVAVLGGTDMRTDLARAHLLFGEWLRRANRPGAARVELGAAHTAFAAMGAHGFAGRALLELRAAGGRAASGPTRAPSPLTPQEAQVAALAADGATNKEIATQLFLSEGTIEYHLTKVFRKLELTSRRQLRRRLAAGGQHRGTADP